MDSHKDVKFIERLFYEQIKGLTAQNKADSFEIQHSDIWI